MIDWTTAAERLLPARERALVQIEAVIGQAPLVREFGKLSRQAPQKARAALIQAVAQWHAETVRHIPVRASRSLAQKRAGVAGALYSRVGRGQLKKRTRPFIDAKGNEVSGGIRSDVDYAIWLAAGTRRIAGGKLLSWRLGDAPIDTWPAKEAGGNPRAELPIILPGFLNARQQLISLLGATIVE